MKLVSREDAKRSGSKWYFTGEPCSRGHIAHRFVSSRACSKCCAEQQRENYHSDLEKGRARSVKKYAASRKRIREAQAQYYLAHRAEILKRCAEARRADPIKRQNQQARWRSRNLEYIKRREAEYRRTNPGVRYLGRVNYRARKRNASGAHSQADVAEIRRLQGNRCAYCAVDLQFVRRECVDHIIPLSRGGSNDRRNLQIVCEPCNCRKHAKDPLVFARQLGRLL